MQGQSSSVMEMGLSSMVQLLQSIAVETVESNKFLKTISETVQSAIDLSKDIFSFTSGKKLETYRRKKELREEQNSLNLKIIASSLLEQMHRPEMIVKNQKNKGAPGNQSSINNIARNVSIYMGKLESKGLKILDSFMTKLADFVDTDKTKFDNVNGFFDRFNTQIEIFNKKGYKAAIALSLITGALLVLQIVSWISIAKMTVVLVTLGIGFAFFFKSIVGAMTNANFFKSVAIMLFLPDVLIAIGKAILMFSAALFVFNYVGYEALLKFAMAMATLGLTYKYFFKDGENLGKWAWFLISLGVSMMLLIYPLMKLNQVEWTSVFKLFGFIVGLGYALRIARLDKAGVVDSPIAAVGLGISILLFALDLSNKVHWSAAFVIISFIVTLGLVMNQFEGGKLRKGLTRSILSLSIGLAVLILSLSAVGELNWSSILMLSVWMIGFGFAVRIALGNSGRGKMSGVFGFALGLAILILTLDAVTELDWNVVLQLTAWVLGLALAIRVIQGGGKVPGLLGFAFGLAIMVLAMDAMTELNEGAMLMTLLFLTGLGLAMQYFPKATQWNMLILAGSMLVIWYAMSKVNETQWNIKNLLIFAGIIVVLGGIMAIMGIPAVAALLETGALVFISMMVGLLIGAASLWLLSKIDFDLKRTLNLVASIALITMTFAILTPFILVAAVSSIAFIPVAIAALLAGLSIWAISNMDFDTKAISEFSSSILSLTWTYAKLLPIILPATIASLLFIPVALSALLGAYALKKISEVTLSEDGLSNFKTGLLKIMETFNSFGVISVTKAAYKAVALLPVLGVSYLAAKVLEKIGKTSINDSNIESFKVGLSKIMNIFDSFGLIATGKAALKATAMLPIMGIAYLAALTMKKIADTDIKQEKIDMFSNMINYLTDKVLISLSDNEAKLEKAKPGIEALSKLLSTFKSLGDVIQLMSKMKFYEMGVDSNGKLVYKSVRELTPADLKRFSANIATLIETLVSPLSILGSDADVINIGGKNIKNPFKNKQTLEGINIIGKLGNAYKPLAESILTLLQSGVMGDAKKSKEFMDSMIGISSVYLWFFSQVEKYNPKVITDVMKLIEQYNDSINGLRVKHIRDLNDIFESFVTKLTDDLKWRKIERNLISLKKHFKDISGIVNSINIQKADKFEKVVRALVDRQNGKGLVEAAEALRDILTQVNESYVKQQETFQKSLDTFKEIQQNATTQQTAGQQTFGVGSGVMLPGQSNPVVQQNVPQQTTQQPVVQTGNLTKKEYRDLLEDQVKFLLREIEKITISVKPVM